MNEEKQLTLEDLENEIEAALQEDAVNGTEKNRAARKPFRITDFDPPKDKEMAVFTHAKKLSEYIFVITEKSPKKFRWSIITRLQNASVEVIENLYRANFERDAAARLSCQKSAAVNLSLIDFYAETARRKQAITVRQTAIIARQIAETKNLLNGWIKSTRNRQ